MRSGPLHVASRVFPRRKHGGASNGALRHHTRPRGGVTKEGRKRGSTTTRRNEMSKINYTEKNFILNHLLNFTTSALPAERESGDK